MKRLPLLLKAVSGVGAALLVAAVVQRFLLRWAFETELDYLEAHGIGTGLRSSLATHFLPRVALAIGGPLAVSAVCTGAVFSMMVRARGLPLVEALHRIAQGSFDTSLPEAPDRDFRAVRDAFDTMRLALDRAMSRLAHADAQRRRLFADLAHELATPTSALLGLVDTLGRPDLCPSEADRAHLVTLVEGEAVRIARLVADVRDLAELDDPDVSFTRAPADVAAIVAGAVSRFRPEEAPRITLEAAPVIADVDEARLDQVIANLIVNARRHTPPDGEIAVTVRAAPQAAEIVVEDSGPGVAEEALAQLGERLYRADPSRDRRTGGHGLGLSIARAILRRHEGSIAFGRAARGGLSVTISIPRRTEEEVSRRRRS